MFGVASSNGRGNRLDPRLASGPTSASGAVADSGTAPDRDSASASTASALGFGPGSKTVSAAFDSHGASASDFTASATASPAGENAGEQSDAGVTWTASSATPLVRLVPQSGIQFIDLSLPTAELAQARTSFTEHRFAAGGSTRTVLMPLERSSSGDGIIWHPVTHRALAPAEIMSITGFSAIEPFLGTWVPLPVLRYLGTDATGQPTFDAGPENWARVFVSAVADDLRDAESVALTVAFDTRLDAATRSLDNRYLAPNSEDVLLGSTFKFAASAHDLTPFVSRPWIDAWLRNSVDAFRRKSADGGSRNLFELEHIARYLAFIDVLERFCSWPELRFVDTLNTRWPVPFTDVDLVLDLGDRETAALLIDQAAENARSQLSAAASLAPRDLSSPAIRHRGAIPTRAEFATQPFGETGLSRLSGRPDAFLWPSFVRVGREAERLALAATATEGITGHSALTALMTETEPLSEDWRIGSEAGAGGSIGPLVSGALLAHLAQDGTLLGQDGGGAAPAIRPRFAPASLLTFYISELLLHAITEINAPDMISEPRRARGVRQLRRLVVTAPAAMSPVERASLTNHAQQAIQIVWRAMGWDVARDNAAPPPPTVTLGLGSDLAAQLFVLRREMAARFDSDMRALLEFTGRKPDARGQSVVRVASVDFGTTASGVVVVDYQVAADGSFAPLSGAADRLEGGEETVLGEIARQFVLPAITAALSDHGVANADLVLASCLDSLTSRDGRNRALARRLQSKVIRPAAVALLKIARDLPGRIANGQRNFTLRYLVELGGGRLEPDSRAFEMMAERAGAERGGAAPFKLGAVQVRLSQRQLSAAILDTVAPVMQRIAALSGQQECDLLLVSGDLAAVPAVSDGLFAQVPLEPGRIVITTRRDGLTAGSDNARLAALPTARMAGLAGAYLAGENGADLEAFNRVALEIGNKPLQLARAAAGPNSAYQLGHQGNGHAARVDVSTGSSAIPPSPATDVASPLGPPSSSGRLAAFGVRAAAGDEHVVVSSNASNLGAPDRGVKP